jgi:hypothetical protein
MKFPFHLACLLLLILAISACRRKTESEELDALGILANTDDTPFMRPLILMPLTSVEFPVDFFDFGKIVEGTKASHTFFFKNTGENELFVQTVNQTCGCTKAAWTRTGVPVGGEGWITLEFDSKNNLGHQQKSVTILFLNTAPKSQKLQFMAEVIPK